MLTFLPGRVSGRWPAAGPRGSMTELAVVVAALFAVRAHQCRWDWFRFYNVRRHVGNCHLGDSTLLSNQNQHRSAAPLAGRRRAAGPAPGIAFSASTASP
jgi:hypothetical protein